MPNLYIGTNTNQHSGIVGAVLRSGYNKKLTGTALNSTMGFDDVKATTAGATGTQFGAFTACGGIAVRTATEVYVLHSTASAYLNSQWNTAGNWLCDNKGAITQAVLINFGNNADNGVTDPIWGFFTTNGVPAIRISRNGTTAGRISADLTGVFFMNKVDYTNPVVNTTWVAMAGQQVVNQ